MIIKKCPLCGKDFEASSNRKIYCSVNCTQKAYYNRKVKKIPVTGKCPVCGKEFEIKTNRQYCSEECKKKSKMKTIVCEVCGKTVLTSTRRKYCSEECGNIAKNEKNRERDRYRDRRKKKPPVKSNSALAEVTRAARDAGLSYGQYVAMNGSGNK